MGNKGVSHTSIVYEILPRFAERLKSEKIIQTYDRKQFLVPMPKGWTSLKVNPDLVLHLPNGKKVLVEVANPRDPKRFVGELFYPQIIGLHKMVDAAIVFVIHGKHTRGMIQAMMINQIIKKQIPLQPLSWSENEEVTYRNLKLILTQQFVFFKF